MDNTQGLIKLEFTRDELASFIDLVTHSTTDKVQDTFKLVDRVTAQLADLNKVVEEVTSDSTDATSK